VIRPSSGYNNRCLEKRSQALQACNLTRNIQADGAPMVHRTPEGAILRGFFFTPSDTGAMPQKTHLVAGRGVSFCRGSRLGASTVVSSSVCQAIEVAHAPIGDSPWAWRSMKSIERSKIGSGFIQRTGTLHETGPCIAKELRSER
jgi:hypothetical protein